MIPKALEWHDWIRIIANIASITTAILASVAWGNFKFEARKKMRKMETYLKEAKESDAKIGKRGLRSILNLMARVGLTEDEVLKSSFKSAHIKRALGTEEGSELASVILFEYDPSGKSN